MADYAQMDTQEVHGDGGELPESNKTHVENLVIIGAGPSGLTAAIYAARAGLHPRVLMGTTMPGGQLMTTTDVENFPGFPDGVTGPELMDRMQRQAEKFGAITEEVDATNLFLVQEDPQYWGIACTSTDPNQPVQIIQTKSVIIATGNTAKWLGLANESLFQNNGLSACATCDGPLPRFENQHLHVVGGGDSAIEESLFLTRFAKKVTMLVRSHKLSASKYMQDRALANEKISIQFHTSVIAYLDAQKDEDANEKQDEKVNLTYLTLLNNQTQEQEQVETGGVFLAIGHSPATGWLKPAPADKFGHACVALTPLGHVSVSDHVKTNLSKLGIFAAGDVHDGHYRQAVTAAGFGCMAALEAERYLSSLL